MDDDFSRTKARVYLALKDSVMQNGIQRGMASFFSNLNLNLADEEVVKISDEVEETKSSADIQGLVKQAIDSMQRNGVDVFSARNKEEALGQLKKLTDEDKLIVKSKSMVAEEVGETDLGEFIIQLKHDKPAQMVAPSLHVPREEVAALLSKFFKTNFDKDDLQGMVNAVRLFLREKIAKADAGITGANAISAKEGTIVTVENEGNIRLTMTMPRKHIVLTSIEKVVPSTLDAVKVALAQSYFAGYTKPTYISLTSTPSGTGDIEKVMVRPAQGSKEMHVILLDNGRLSALNSPFSNALKCIKCGACQMVCPTYSVCGPAWGGDVYTSAIGLIWTAITDSAEKAANLSYFCLGCDACNEVCPVSIDISGMISALKQKGSSKV